MHFLRCLLFLFSLIYSASSCLVVINVLTTTKPPTTEKPCCSKVPELASEEFIDKTFIQTVPKSVLADYQDVIKKNCTFTFNCYKNYPPETIQYKFFAITQSSSNPAVTNVVSINGLDLHCPFGSDIWHVDGDEVIAIGCYIIMLVPWG
ncbi:unnamed protein product [Caenorhabditis brenneri]